MMHQPLHTSMYLLYPCSSSSCSKHTVPAFPHTLHTPTHQNTPSRHIRIHTCKCECCVLSQAQAARNIHSVKQGSI